MGGEGGRDGGRDEHTRGLEDLVVRERTIILKE